VGTQERAPGQPVAPLGRIVGRAQHGDGRGGEQRLEVAGTFRLPEGKPAEIALTGDASCKSVKIKDLSFDSISTSFAWRDQSLYLRDIEVTQKNLVARGKAMWRDHVLRLSLESNLPLASCRPFFKDSTFGNVLDDFKETDRTAVDVTIGGSIDFENTDDWRLTGQARMTHASYRGTPFNWAQTDLDLSHKALDFLNGLEFPLSRPIAYKPGEIQRWTPSIEVLPVPDIDSSLNEADAKQQFWTAFKVLGEWYENLPPY